MKNIPSLFLVALLLFSSCGESNEVRQFNFEKEGGTQVILEIDMPIFFESKLNGYTDPKLREILKKCDNETTNSPKAYFNMFCDEAENLDYSISNYFNKANPAEFEAGKSNEEMKEIFITKYKAALDGCMEPMENRLDKAEWTYNLYQNKSDQIVVEVTKEVDKSMVHRKVVAYADFGFYHCMPAEEGYEVLTKLEKGIVERLNPEFYEDSTYSLGNHDTSAPSEETTKKMYPIFFFVNLNTTVQSDGMTYINQGAPEIGYAKISDTSHLNQVFNDPENQPLLSENVLFYWGHKPIVGQNGNSTDLIPLYMLKKPEASMWVGTGDIEEAEAREDQQQPGQWEIYLTFTEDGARKWAGLTEASINQPLAIVMDNIVFSAPQVLEKMDTGEAKITGQFSEEEAKDIAGILFYSSLSYQLKIIKSN